LEHRVTLPNSLLKKQLMPDRHLSQNPDPPHVLVIEDNRDLAKLFCDLLEIVGCTTEIATTVNAALGLVKKKMPQLIFCDLGLPGEKSGFEFPQELRALGNIGNVRLIAVTGYSSPEDHTHAIKSGFECVLTKPFKFAEIQTIIDSVRRS
jgi:CheY-like chemotaxis protein